MKKIASFLLVVALAGCDGGGSEEPEPSVPERDELPTLTWTEPLRDAVATPEVLVVASCTDDRGDCRLAVAADSVAVGEVAINELSREIDLSDFDGQMVSLRISATDSAAQTRSASRIVYVESSPELTNERSFPLRVVDFDGQRALLQREVDPIGSELTIAEVASAIEENVDVPGLFEVQQAYLTPTGAVFAGLLEDDIALGDAYDWNHSLLDELQGNATGLQVAGDYVTWVDRVDSALVRRQFSTMTDLVVHQPGGGGHSVASNGVVAFSDSTGVEARSQVLVFDAGVTTILAADADRDNVEPRTDGQGVVYTKYNPEADSYEIAFHDGTGEVVLTGPRSELPEAGSDYAIAGGWVAFTEFGELGQTNVWTRAPSGALLQRTAFEVDSLVEALAPDGEVMVVTTELRTLGEFGHIARYLSRPTGELTHVSSGLGRSTRMGDTWYVIIGASVFEVR